ncbi:hypothetical protein DH2020_028676 [Rehmannia glutinosa]|uniref:YTH domain-containing family protein n=1 Tax=Rehmannia glutinosa TaxID=99300 RepID=A0ABR0VTH2_REHGL
MVCLYSASVELGDYQAMSSVSRRGASNEEASRSEAEELVQSCDRNSGKVILIFSVNMSGFFQGYAQMMSSVGWRRDNIWSQGTGKNTPWGRSFKVKWLRLNDLPFQKTLHLKNPWNDFKPVKISRDCQELPGDIGEALCELLDEGYDMDVNLKRDEVSGGDFYVRRPYIEPFLYDDDINVPPMHMAPVLYPSLLYQHQAEVSRFQMPHQRAGVILNNSSNVPGAPKVKQSRSCQINGSSANRIDTGCNNWGLSAEGSPLIGTFTEDDILEMQLASLVGILCLFEVAFVNAEVEEMHRTMLPLHLLLQIGNATYEEYLEAHTRGSRRLHHSAAGRSTSLQKSSSSKERSDDS